MNSKINAIFTEQEFLEHLKSTNKEYDRDYSSHDVYKILNKFVTNNSIPAFINDPKNVYEREHYKKQDDKYSLLYSYNYNYDNISKNNYLNTCFETFVTYDDENYYYYKISGKNKCKINPQRLVITSKYGVGINNADKKEDNKYIWEIKDNNDIKFSISKKELNKESEFWNIFRIISCIVIIIGGFVIVYFSKNKKH